MPSVSLPNNKFNDASSYIIVDGERIKFEITFRNKETLLQIPIDNFVSLEVEESINSPFYKGLLKIKNDNNRFDILYSPKKNVKIEYNFEETGENLIFIKMMREKEESTKLYVFNVIDESSEMVENTKTKVLYLENASLFYLQNNKSFFSTSELVEKITDVTQLSDNDRQVNVSKAIKRVFENTLDGFFVDDDNWYISSNKTNFTSNINDSSLDCIDYLLDKALDQDNNFLYLLQRNNKFGLYSIKKMYDEYLAANHPENYGGNFFLTSEESPQENVNNKFSFRISDFSVYNENSKHTLNRLVNHKVINYDFKSKYFNIFSKDNTIDNLSSYINNDLLNVNTSINRVENVRIKNNNYFNTIYSTNPDENSSRYEGKNILFKNLINLSTMLTMRSPGVYNLNVGNFVNIQYEAGIKNKKTNKLNGGWFVVGYKHLFKVNSFSTEVICTKFHELDIT